MIWNLLKRLFCFNRCSVTLFGRTDTGQLRPNNEDSFATIPEDNLMMVADGMGGHNAGEIASRIAIEFMVRKLAHGALDRVAANRNAVRHFLTHAMRQVNEEVMVKACDNSAYAGMGCTFIVGYINRGLLYTCHVGDVRAYLLSHDGLRQLTDDHTYYAEINRAGATTSSTPTGKKVTRHVVSRAIGFPFPEDPDCTITPVSAGDRVLLCSDGLWSMLPDSRLETILRQAPTPEVACDQYIAEANEAGGKDNITAVVCFL